MSYSIGYRQQFTQRGNMKTIKGKELNAQIDRLVTETRQLARKFKSLEMAACEKESEAKAFYALLNGRYNEVSSEEELETLEKFLSLRKVRPETVKAAEEEVDITSEPIADSTPPSSTPPSPPPPASPER